MIPKLLPILLRSSRTDVFIITNIYTSTLFGGNWILDKRSTTWTLWA